MATRPEDLTAYEVRDEDRLPWLESAEDDYREGTSWATIAVLVALGLSVIVAAIWGISWYRNHDQVPVGDGTLIAAPEGPYKVKPDQPGGMSVGGEGDTALATSQGGAQGDGAINLGAAPEAPVVGQRAAPGAAPRLDGGAVAVPGSGGRLAATRPDAALARAPLPSAGGALVQLGSFPSAAMANEEWTGKAKRFGYLAPLGHAVERAEVNGNVVYRLRVNAGSAGAAQVLCGKLKVAGEDCFIPN